MYRAGTTVLIRDKSSAFLYIACRLRLMGEKYIALVYKTVIFELIIKNFTDVVYRADRVGLKA